MRDLYILACGIVIGCSLVEWLDRYERRIAYRAMDLAAEADGRRRRWEAQTGPKTDTELHSETPAPA